MTELVNSRKKHTIVCLRESVVARWLVVLGVALLIAVTGVVLVLSPDDQPEVVPAGPEQSESAVPEGSGSEGTEGPKRQGDAVVWVTGDSCDNDDEEIDCADVASLMASDPDTDAVLAVGDLQYDRGTAEEFNKWYDPKMGEGAGLKSKTYPVPGNHEYHTPDAAGYFDYWGDRAGDRGKGYYAFDLNDWKIIAANSNCSEIGGCSGSHPIGVFMREQLAEPETCELVFGHHPAFSDGKHGDQKFGRSIFAITYNNGGDLYVAGHDHNYQRFAPMTPEGKTDPVTGVPQFVVGTGGSNLTEWQEVNRSEYRQNEEFGALRLVLKPTGYTAEFISVDGDVMDSSSGTCH